jgi:hypothetical protein
VNPRNVIMLARAIARDDKVGVSLGQVQLVYGQVPENSDVALDLKLADGFLGDIVFARRKWTKGYRFASGYEPKRDTGSNVAVFFRFGGFDFETDQEEVRLRSSGLDITLIPLTETKSAEGGHLPDLEAIRAGQRFPQFELNASHISENIGYYRQEKIIEQTFGYGELAAFLRGLKASGVNLANLANAVEWSTDIHPAATRTAAPDIADMRKPIDNLFDAWRRIDLADYLAQWSQDAVKYDKDKRSSFAELRAS